MESAILTPKRTEYGKAIRKQYESGAVKESRHNMTELEPRTDGISNTLTTVQKDNLLLEVNKLGNIYGFDDGNYAGNVYDSENIAPTLRSHSRGNTEPMIVQKDNMVLEVKNPLKGKTEYGWHFEQNVYDSDGLIRAIKSSGGSGNIPKVIEKLENICINDRGFSDKEPQITVGTAPTLRAETHGNLPKVIESQYRIRKLTPLECWRLMDFSDEDFHKAESVNSNSQLYKQSGNSICRNVLVAIFGQMMPRKEKVYMESEE